MMREPDLRETIAVIIGAGRAPAPALALALAKHGASIAANDLSPALLDPVVESAAGLPGTIRAYPADATRGMPLRSMIDEILDDWGAIDVLINNPRIRPEASLLEIDEWDWQRTVEMNLTGPFMTMQQIARLMREQKSGVIINIVDTSPERLNSPGSMAYAATQQGLRSLSLAAAKALISYNIRVHTIGLEDASAFDPVRIPQASGVVQPGGLLAQLVVYLSSPAAAHLAGEEFMVCDRRVDPEPAVNWQGSMDPFSSSKE